LVWTIAAKRATELDPRLNIAWLQSPKNAWNNVKYRDWLVATLLEEIAGHKQEFVALSEPLIASVDVLGKEFTRDMKGVTKAIRELLETDSKKERSLYTTLSLAVSKRQQNGKDVFLLGAGISHLPSLTDRSTAGLVVQSCSGLSASVKRAPWAAPEPDLPPPGPRRT